MCADPNDHKRLLKSLLHIYDISNLVETLLEFKVHLKFEVKCTTKMYIRLNFCHWPSGSIPRANHLLNFHSFIIHNGSLQQCINVRGWGCFFIYISKNKFFNYN